MQHLIDRNYRPEIDPALSFREQVLELARLFRGRLTALVADWMRVKVLPGNFNSDNCAASGSTLDYGPFGFCELFDPRFQPWTGGGAHFCFFNQPKAAEANFRMLWKSLRTLLDGDDKGHEQLDQLMNGFAEAMQQQLEGMWASKLGLPSYDESLVSELLQLLVASKADFTKVFRLLCGILSIHRICAGFYLPCSRRSTANGGSGCNAGVR